MLQWEFSRGTVRRVLAECSADNGASIRVLQKIGMTRTHRCAEMLWWELRRPEVPEMAEAGPGP
ncbi:MAG: GNAT family N-acetyltransferase [Bacillota bacterium]